MDANVCDKDHNPTISDDLWPFGSPPINPAGRGAYQFAAFEIRVNENKFVEWIREKSNDLWKAD